MIVFVLHRFSFLDYAFFSMMMIENGFGTSTGPDVALLYKPEGRGFDSRWCHWNFSLTQSFRLYYGPGVDSASNRNEYQDYFLGG